MDKSNPLLTHTGPLNSDPVVYTHPIMFSLWAGLGRAEWDME